MLHMLMRLRAKWIAAAMTALLTAACEPSLPDDLPTLMHAMGENSQTTSVNATNKVARLYGQTGLLQARGDNNARVRARAAFRLRDFPSPDVEQALLSHAVAREPDSDVRVQALWSLKEVGSARALSVLEEVKTDDNPAVATWAREAIDAIRARAR